ncbi:hypothetical protein CEXT_169061 [Caerostris extrusa]|uniref:Uncharacterized protein n=1 Tax=Caerostris extrusa TaxID=172846 RepID=A0AAV4XQM4_CAEEX|nr:hypothetical protein CEXT_169061 [Caerostris extrusa]
MGYKMCIGQYRYGGCKDIRESSVIPSDPLPPPSFWNTFLMWSNSRNYLDSIGIGKDFWSEQLSEIVQSQSENYYGGPNKIHGNESLHDDD